MDIKKEAQMHLDYMIDFRRDLHMHPEESFKEFRTTDRIVEELEKLGITCHRFDPTGVMADIVGDHPGKTVALRADIDALTVTEENDVPYKSQNEGVMHACGHDSHAAMLLGAAKLLSENRDSINGTVRVIFQPAEETISGAKALIAQGCLNGVDNIAGIHIYGGENGVARVSSGPITAAGAKFWITVHGKGGHGARPNTGVDAAVIAGAILTNIQTLVSREVDPMQPLVVSIGKVTAGSRYNVIASEALLEGTVRFMDSSLRDVVGDALRRMVTGICEAHRGSCDIIYTPTVEVTMNEDASAARMAAAMEKITGNPTGPQKRSLGSEDFSEYSVIIPGAYGALHAGSPFSNHHPEFDIDESNLALGAGILSQYALDFLDGK